MELIEQKPKSYVRQVSVSEDDDRLTIKIDVYWQHFGEDPIGRSEVVSDNLINTGVEPYVRKIKVGETPCSLEIGDIPKDQMGYIFVTNIEGLRLRQNPTQEELEDIKSRVVLLDGWEIAPYGMPFIGKASQASKLEARCLHGEAVLQVSIFPK